MIFKLGFLRFGDNPEGPDPGVKHQTWHKVNVVAVEQIPGKGKHFITIRTSDGTLEECTLTVRSVTYKQYKLIQLLCDMGGPFEVVSPHGVFWMYVMDRSVEKDETDKELPLKETATDEKLNVATWTLQLLEAKD